MRGGPERVVEYRPVHLGRSLGTRDKRVAGRGRAQGRDLSVGSAIREEHEKEREGERKWRRGDGGGKKRRY